MKNTNYLIIFIFVILNSSSSLGQSFDKGSPESKFVEFFNAKSGSLDQIEGIWIRKSSSYSYYEDNKGNNCTNQQSESEIAIISYQGKLSIYFIEDGACIAKDIPECKITTSAIPNRYFFSSEWVNMGAPPYCFNVSAISFSVVNNSFSISYSQTCHTGSGTTLSTVGSYFDYKSTDNWSKIYPVSE